MDGVLMLLEELIAVPLPYSLQVYHFDVSSLAYVIICLEEHRERVLAAKTRPPSHGRIHFPALWSYTSCRID